MRQAVLVIIMHFISRDRALILINKIKGSLMLSWLWVLQKLHSLVSCYSYWITSTDEWISKAEKPSLCYYLPYSLGEKRWTSTFLKGFLLQMWMQHTWPKIELISPISFSLDKMSKVRIFLFLFKHFQLSLSLSRTDVVFMR